MIDIKTVRANVKSNCGKNIKIRQNVGRNKTLEYEGVITNIYPNLFVIETENDRKTFSYSDVLIKNIIIKIK